jgi:hypothetical protein
MGMAKRLTRSGHTRREFLRALGVAGVAVAGGAAMSGVAMSGVASAADRVGAADVFVANLDTYADRVRKYTTPWGEVVDDWYPAFVAAHADLAAYGGGKLLVSGGDASAERKYHISAPVVFDLPSISVHLAEHSYVERVGAPDIRLGAPLAFHGFVDDAQRGQRDYAALFGPGKVGYRPDRLALYPHENGVGISHYKAAYVDRLQVPHAPGKGLTAQFGCNLVSFTNNTIGPTSQSAEEQAWAGQAAITVQGGWNPPDYPLFTEVAIKWNTVAESVRGVYVDMSRQVEIAGNTFAPTAHGGLTLGACGTALIRDNTLKQVSRGAVGQYNAIDLYGVDAADLVRNTVLNTTHKHCVYSAPRAGHVGVWHDHGNHWTRGQGPLFGGTPPQG